MKRSIGGLRYAYRLSGRPAGIPVGRPRGAKAAGVRYEGQVADQIGRMFAGAEQGVWFEYADRAGRGLCQTDVLLVREDRVVVFECKYTWTRAGFAEVEKLYTPILQKVYGLPVQGIVVSKVLTPDVKGPVFGTLAQALLASGPATWHCLGGPKLRRGRASVFVSPAAAARKVQHSLAQL